VVVPDRAVASYFRSLEHLLRSSARPPFALERLSVIRGSDGRITRVRYVLPRHKAATWVGQRRGRKSTRSEANGVVELSPPRVPRPARRSRPAAAETPASLPRVFAPNHKLRRAVTALTVGNIGKQRGPVAGEHEAGRQPTEGCCERLIRQVLGAVEVLDTNTTLSSLSR
jgi:hypothetical protein